MLPVLALFLLLNSAPVNNQAAEFYFLKSTLRLPKTPEGEIVRFEYQFMNHGKAPLVIREIKVQCTCTTFEFPKDPVPPDGTGIIKVSFNTKGKIGYQDRTLEVHSNAENSPYTLRFKIMVNNKK